MPLSPGEDRGQKAAKLDARQDVTAALKLLASVDPNALVALVEGNAAAVQGGNLNRNMTLACQSLTLSILGPSSPTAALSAVLRGIEGKGLAVPRSLRSKK